jgi:preprotein translocase YajC subunit
MGIELLFLLAAFVAFILFSNRRRKSAAQQLENSVKVGAKAVMLGGITGVITEIRETTVIVETVPGVKIEFLKAAVRSVETPSLDAKPEQKAVTAKTAAAKKPASTTAKKAPAAKATTTKANSSTTKSAK